MMNDLNTIRAALLNMLDDLIDNIYDLEGLSLDDDIKDSLVGSIVSYKFDLENNKIRFDKRNVMFPVNENMLRRFIDYKDDIFKHTLDVYNENVIIFKKISNQEYNAIIDFFEDVIDNHSNLSEDINEVFNVSLNKESFISLSAGIEKFISDALLGEEDFNEDEFVAFVELECLAGMMNTATKEYCLMNSGVALNDDERIIEIIDTDDTKEICEMINAISDGFVS